MKIADFLKSLTEHNKTGSGYQIYLNSDNLGEESTKNTGIEIGDLYFTECSTLKGQTLLCFGNMARKPTGQSEDGTNLYPAEINTNLFLDVNRIEAVETVEDFQDWFYLPSSKVVNVYMYPENNGMDGNRNVVTIGFMS